MSNGCQNILNLVDTDGNALEIRGIALDSKQIRKDFLFAALPGLNTHGANFIQDAIERGAIAVLTDKEGQKIALESSSIQAERVIPTSNPRKELAKLASKFYQNVPHTCVAVTGTNGKTSVATMCRQIWEELNIDAVNIGTTGIEGGYSAALDYTTPDAIALHKHLANIKKSGIEHVALEASSHGLSQGRLDGVEFSACAFTNLTRDHFDYHSSMEDYFASKCILFKKRLSEEGTAVICLDTEWGKKIAYYCQETKKKVIAIGNSEGEIQIIGQKLLKNGQNVAFAWNDKVFEKHLNLIGDFQLKNVLTAAALAIGSGCKAEEVFAVLDKIKPVRGRMELVSELDNGGLIFIDYAHTPDALLASLQSLRKHCLNKIRVLFGAGGDRDQGKRRIMGTVASRWADYVYVTDDNPRQEDPAKIRSEILQGCPEAKEIGDRSMAIFQAIEDLKAGESLLIAGKGHETQQIIGTTSIPFDDAEHASIAARIVDRKNPG